MATYTTQVRSLVEAGYDIFDRTRPFPIFDESYRETLEQNIIDHYYFREIGLETAAQFKHMLNSRLRLIMPYYNKMYESERIEYDPMVTFDLKETFKRTNAGTSEKNDTSSGTSVISDTSTGQEVFSDTPQGKLSGLDYATTVSESTDSKNQNNTINANGLEVSSVSGNEEYEKQTVGNTGTTSDSRLIMDFRKSFLRIDEDIIKELRDLFMNIY